MRYGSAEPKPFAFVDIKGAPKREDYVPHDTYSGLTGKLELTIEVISDYLFVGSGNYDFRERDKLVYYSFFRTNGNITIPGTSIKGAVRSVAEAISNSCVSQRKKGRGEEKCASSHFECEFKPEKEKKELCPACSLFGTTGYGGRVSFSDASTFSKIEPEVVKISELWGPRINKGRRKFYQNKRFNPVGNLKPERNYRLVEAIKKASKFCTTLGFQNVSEAELSLLLHAMGIEQQYRIKIGGAKPRCFGTVRFTAGEFKVLSVDLLSFEKKPISEVMMNNDLIETEHLEQFKKEISKEEELCPKEMY